MISKITVLTRFLFVLVFVFCIDWYAYQAIRSATQNASKSHIGTITIQWKTIIRGLFWFINICFYVFLLIGIYFALTQPIEANSRIYQRIFAVFVLLYAPKLLLIAFLFTEDLYRLVTKLFSAIFSQNNDIPSSKESTFLTPRREFVSQVALLIASIPFAGILHGITLGRWNFTVFKETLYFDDLPDEFDGFQILQISDIHAGSFDNAKEVQKGIDLILAQKADVILFTGDLVNNVTEEMHPWESYFSQLKAPNGVFSIVGNHDYGDYVQWESTAHKQDNFNRLINLQRKMGWNILLNQNAFIERKGKRIAIVGVENWGKPPFPQVGDLNKALEGVDATDFKILLSHDPSHWDAQTIHHPHKIHLTFSGHTHGMQFGIEIAGFKWSPVSLKYPRWAGLYQEAGKFLYVNRGFGTIGFPGRVGIFPEITMITLKKIK